jgi:hemerythrin
MKRFNDSERMAENAREHAEMARLARRIAEASKSAPKDVVLSLVSELIAFFERHSAEEEARILRADPYAASEHRKGHLEVAMRLFSLRKDVSEDERSRAEESARLLSKLLLDDLLDGDVALQEASVA